MFNFISKETEKTYSSHKVTIVLGGIKMARAILSILTISISAKYFGISTSRDSWILVSALVSVFIQLLFGGLNETFRTKYIYLREHSSTGELKQHVNGVITFAVLISFIAILLVLMFPRLIGNVLASGFSKHDSQILYEMIRVLFPSLVLTELTLLLSAILNAHNSFFLPDFFGFLSVILNILFIVILSPFIGIYSLVVSGYVSSLMLLIYLYFEMKKKLQFTLKIEFHFLSYVLPFLSFSLPLYINYFISQIDTLIEKNLTTHMEIGSVSLIDYARKFSDLPTNILIGVVTTALTPMLSALWVKGKYIDFWHEARKYFRMLSILIIPFICLLFVYSDELVTIFFLHGKFRAEDVPVTSSLMKLYIVGSFFVVAYIIFVQILISRNKVVLFTIVAALGYLMRSIFNLFFYKELGISIFPVSWAAVTLFMTILMLLLDSVKSAKSFLFDISRVYIATLMTGLVILWSRNFTINYFSSFNTLTILIIGCVVIVPVYLCILYLLRFDEIGDVYNKLKGRLTHSDK